MATEKKLPFYLFGIVNPPDYINESNVLIDLDDYEEAVILQNTITFTPKNKTLENEIYTFSSHGVAMRNILAINHKKHLFKNE